MYRGYIQGTFTGSIRWIVAGKKDRIVAEGTAETVAAAEAAAEAAIKDLTTPKVKPQLSLWEGTGSC